MPAPMRHSPAARRSFRYIVLSYPATAVGTLASRRTRLAVAPHRIVVIQPTGAYHQKAAGVNQLTTATASVPKPAPSKADPALTLLVHTPSRKTPSTIPPVR